MKSKIYIYLLLVLSSGFITTKVNAQYSFTSTTLEYDACDSLFYRLGISTYHDTSSYDSLTVHSYFGDGSSSTVTALPGTPRAYVGHHYSTAGVYTVKSVLMYNGIAEDSIVFSDTVNLCSTMHIVGYVDANTNCHLDSGEVSIRNPFTIEIDSNGVPVDTITSTSLYYVGGGVGTVYAFKILSLPAGYILSCPADSVVYDSISTTMPSTLYATFGFTCDTSSFDLHVWGWFSAGLTGACSHVYAYEYECSSVPSCSLTINYSTKYAYSSNSLGLTPSASGTGWVTFSLGTLSPDSAASMEVYYTAVGTPSLGDTTNTTWTIDPITGDANPTNNVHSEVDTVRSSYDPNEKSVSPQGYITSGTPLQYAIGFENTGNDTAFNINVLDTLSSYLNISTFKLVSASAPVTTEILTTTVGQNVVKFNFPHIKLLDSSHPGKNTGMVIFNINAKSGLSAGTVINNRAGIYFDYNPVVMTNVTTNIIGTPASVAVLSNAGGISIFPNPAESVLNVSVSGNGYNEITIMNELGVVVSRQPVTSSLNTINIASLPTGMYFVNIYGENGSRVFKFVKD